MMRVTILGGALLATLLMPMPDTGYAAEKTFRIGYFVARGPDAKLDGAFERGLRELGYTEGRTITIERRFAHNQAKQLPVIAKELAALNLDAIVVAPAIVAVAMSKATSRTPIIMATGGDPVGLGLTTDLSRPDRNVTGLTNVSTDLLGKEVELLREAVPGMSHISLLTYGASIARNIQIQETTDAARRLRIKLDPVTVDRRDNFETAFASMRTGSGHGLVVALEPLFFGERASIAEFARKIGLPAISSFREFAEAGGLIAYGPALADMFRRSAAYVDKILKGSKPGELPIEQPLLFELIVNLRTAKALGITIPPTLLLRADEVIK